MTNITIFEPAMCCSTGVCGPSVDQDLMRITAVMEALGDVESYEALRYNLSNNPDEFIKNKDITEFLQSEGADALPITMVDGKIVKTGGYPSNDEITDYIGVRFIEVTDGECGCGSCGCGSEEEDEEEGCGCGAESEGGCCQSEKSEKTSCCGGHGGCC